MLARLSVKNLALVEKLAIDFEPGLNVITGETGAGKSILIGALGLLLGERADKKIIRSGEDSCGVEAFFQLEQPEPVNRLLDAIGAEPCVDGALILRRVVKANGANQQSINDSPATLQTLKQLGDLLVDMHGPHDHQSLLSRAAQLAILDAYGRTDKEREAYEACWRRLAAIRDQMASLEGDDADVEAQIDLLAYRIKEIEELAPVEGEEEQIVQEHKTVSHAQRIRELGDGVTSALTESDGSAFDALASVQKMLEELADLVEDGTAWREEAKTLAVGARELSAAVASRVADIETDPARMEWLEQRMAAYQKLKRKYGGSVASALETLEDSRRRLHHLKTRGEQLENWRREEQVVVEALTKEGRKLRDKRKKAATRLADDITGHLRDLGFAHGVFSVEWSECEPRSGGMDEVEFGFAPNRGEAKKPLRDIASSGEISRVMLATKAVLAEHDAIPVLIFDEVDANVGGEMGRAIGQKLSVLASARQVICITHLPQVAALGATHFAVKKEVRDERTLSRVDKLNPEARVEEVARMLGGRGVTSAVMTHARELLFGGRIPD
ncbi:MAG TPA: DNA repair protein RecN [Kiritimatiellia bacterium]|nr:DNA repair protein RecN [Kiritimatiellia bacterium]HMO99886.1 DNA repair protein RecN [Kiritimatiellia bacterium]HMP98111.1 DNA repair protein RecN [Kiritimatiellia bacterium]